MRKFGVLLILLVLGALLVACGPKTQPEEPAVDPGETPRGETDLPSEDVPDYDLSDTTAYTVIVSEFASGVEETAARTVRLALEEKFGAKPKLSSDWLTGAPTEEEVAARREILIGKVDRPERLAVSKELSLGFVIRVMGNKIVILGVSDEQTLKAANYFAEVLLPSLEGSLAGDFLYAERYEATLIRPTWSDEPVVAEIIATDIPYYADPTGKTDSTHAIQAALDDCAERGGGTVWLPVGEYLVTSTLYLEPGVILRGDWQDPNSTDTPVYGTVILADPDPLMDHERDDLATKPLINLFSNSGVMGLTFYYPNQNAADPIPYGYTIFSYINNTATIRDITLLNSYRGVGASLLRGDGHCIMQLESLRMCALESGVEMDVSRDVGYAVDICVSPSYWSEASGSYKCDDAAALKKFCRENTVGVTIKSLDDEHFSTLCIEGCRTAIMTATPVNGASFWGLIYDVNIADCTYGIVTDRVNDYGGICIAKATIDADEYAFISTAGTGAVKLCGVELTGKGDVVATGGARVIWDDETDLSDYAIDYGDYERPVDQMYIAPVAALSEAKQDISDVLQATLDEAGKTGGIVYIPAGFYTLTEPITVPAGVQLRGAMDIYTYTYAESEVCGSVILSYVDGEAAITLEEKAGINGLVVFSPRYAPDYALELTEEGDDVVEEAVTVRGEGSGVYVLNSTIIGNFIGIDFTDCDDHLIREAFGCTFNTFARVGGKNGVVDRVMNTFHMVDRNPLANMGKLDSKLCDVAAWVATHDYEAEATSTLRDDLLRTHYNVIEVVGAEGEQVSNVFMFTPGCIIYTEHAKATLINISSDAHGLKPMFDITQDSDVVAVNVLRSGGKSLRVDDSSDFKLYNRVAISDWYEPSFDSTRGDNQERTYEEYGERLMVNDGSITDGVTGIELYEGDEFSASGGTSLYYESNASSNVDTVFVQQFEQPLDLSAYMNEDGYLHLWVYIDDLTNVWWSGYIQVESAGGGSLRWATSTTLRSHGVNELYLPLTGAVVQGSFDATRVNAIRFTNQVGITLEHPVMYIDDVYFTQADIDQPIELMEQSTVDVFSASTPLRENVPAAPVVEREIVDGKLVMFDCETGDGKLLLTKNPAYVKEGEGAWRVSGVSGGSSKLELTFEPLDISSFMEDGYLHLWVFVDGKVRIKDGQIELTSAGTCDVQEIYWNAGSYILHEGWNELKLPLHTGTQREESPFDPTRLNYMRIYFHTTDGIIPNVYYDDIYFYDATPTEGATVKPTGARNQIFTVGDVSETPYLTDKKGSFIAGTVRFADKTNEFIYKYSVAVTDELSHLVWSAKLGQQMLLQVSLDMVNWVDLYRYDGPSDDHGIPMALRKYDLLPFLREHATGKYVALYIRVADASTGTGWGGAVSVDTPVTLEVFYGEYVPETPDEPEMPDEPEVPSEPEIPDEPEVPGEYETRQVYTFMVNTESEEDYLTEERGSFIVGTGKNRYADKDRKFIYAYPISDLSTVSRLVWIASTGQQLHLQVSLDKKDWRDVYRYEGDAADKGLPMALRGYDLLSPLADLLGEERRATLYVKISDAYTDGGWGGAVGISDAVTLYAYYGEVSEEEDPLRHIKTDGTVDQSKMVTQWLMLLDGDTLDETIKHVTLNTDPTYVKQGEASYRHEGGHIYLQANFAEPIDISEYVETGYLHLWIYVGDTPLTYKDGQIEIGSGGREDVSEWCWYMNAYVTKSGWNELYLPLTAATNGKEPLIDPTSINFLRIYCITADGKQPTIYLDSISVCK